MRDIQDRLDELKELGLYRRTRQVSGPQGPRVVLDGKPVLLLCSNNYLGLADHPRVRQAAADAAMRWGVGAGASRLISGNMTIHRRLEKRLADFEGREACVLFGSGYLANTGIVAALAREGEVVFSDALNHASIVDGCRLARAETFVYDHADVEHLAWGLQQAAGRGALIVTDGVFSMDGDVAPLPEIVELAQAYDVRVVVDEAHGTGALGPGGRGRVAGARAALELLEEQPRRVRKLQLAGDLLRSELENQGFDTGASSTQIVPLMVGDAAEAMRACELALEQGGFAQGI